MGKRALLLIACILCMTGSRAEVTFRFAANTIDNEVLASRMENNISALLSSIDRAARDSTALDLADVNITDVARERLTALWCVSRFECCDSSYVAKCQQDFQGYQARGIHVTMLPHDLGQGCPPNRDLVISLDNYGAITGVSPAWQNEEQANSILTTTGAGGVLEIRSRREILKWIEDYKTLYTLKDLDGLTELLNDDMAFEKGIDKLLSSLGAMLPFEDFSTEIDHISVLKHYAVSNVYGITIHQKFDTGMHSESGWIFTLWDFNDPELPVIHARTWQTDEEVTRDGVTALDDFYIR